MIGSFDDQRSTWIGAGVFASGSAGGDGGGAVASTSRAPSFEKRGAALSATTIPVGMPAVDAETSSVAAVSGAFQ